MGEEIHRIRFGAEDFAAFSDRLRGETRQLASMLAAGAFDESTYAVGFELEAWLLDHNGFPSPDNERFLARVDSPLVVSELSRFNIELNGTPQLLRGSPLSAIEAEMTDTWARCQRAAHELEGTLVAIGILPTIREEDLCLANISPMNRYHALNEQVLAARNGRPIRLDIQGRERLALAHPDVMLEAATTSFQVHMQVPASAMARYCNASSILCAPLVAVAANSPYLFQTALWDETRIPLFEQAVDTSDFDHPDACRVSFGEAWLRDSALEVFEDNLRRFAPLLPIRFDAPAGELRHLRLHNGTIWRWVRPLIGFDDTGRPHLRIEFRVLPAGPSMPDMIANAALYLGAAHTLARRSVPPEHALAFEHAHRNFRAAARDGLDARLTWLDGTSRSVADLLAQQIVPMAREGLADLGVDAGEIDRYLDVIGARVRTRQTGAAWQRAHVERHGRDFQTLVADYLEHQRSGMAVHEWDV